MKKFISLFLVISMIMSNLNTGIVEALSSYVNEVKSLDNTEKEKIVDVKEDKGIEKEKAKVSTNNNDVDNTKVIGLESKETAQVHTNNNVDNTKVVDSKNKDEQLQKSSDKKLSTVDDQQTVTLIYDISSDSDEFEVKNGDILDPQEVNLIIKGTGIDKVIQFDNELDCDIPFNIEFDNITGTNCHFSFENVRSINIKGENTILNSSSDDAALIYSFDGIDLNPLKINKDASFIVYNKEEDSMNNNIVYSGNDTDDSGDNSDDSGDNSDDSGDSSIINISFEDDLTQEKKFILDPVVNNNAIQKKFSSKNTYKALSILLVNDGNSYLLKEEGTEQIPYYYRTSNSTDENGENGRISGTIRTKLTLGKNSTTSCYEISNKQRVAVIATKKGIPSYYLADKLEEAINSVNLNQATLEVIFLGNYEITSTDVEAIKTYDKDTEGITFKTKIDDWKYSLNVDEDIELGVNDANTCPVTFDDIKFNYTSDGRWIYANGRQLTFGYGVEMVGQYYPSVSSGKSSSTDSGIINESSLIISSGTYNFVTGDRYSTVKDINLTIYGGTFRKEVSGVSKNSQYNDVISNVTVTISNNNNTTFESKVYGVGIGSNVDKDLKVIINGGTFQDDVIAVDGKVGNNAILTISSNPTFRSRVLGASTGSDIGASLNVSIKGGIFRNQVIGINGGTVKSATLTIGGGTFDNMVLGVSSNNVTEEFTLKGLFSRYLFSKNSKITNNQLNGVNSGLTGVKISMNITGGTFKDDVSGTNVSDSMLTMTVSKGTFRGSLIGNTEGNATDENAIININNSVAISNISHFSKLVLGGTKSATLSGVDKLDKGSLKGDLYLNNGSKIKFKSTSKNSELNDIVLSGENNTLVLDSNKNVNTTKDEFLIDLSGEIKVNENNKLKIEFTKLNNTITSGMYLIKFEEESNADVTNKYDPPEGYYVRDNQEPGYVILCPQTTFDLEYDLKSNILYMIDDKNSKVKAWWYDEARDIDVTLESSELYKYKGYDLFYDPNNGADRKLILTGTSSNKNITVNNNNLNNVNVELKGINLTNSNITLNNLKSLILNGENNINNINNRNVNKYVFTYTFNNNETANKVSFNGDNSYLKIFTNKDTNPFNGSKGERIDLKFNEPFNEEDNTVRLNHNSKIYQFDIPTNTERLGLLLKDKGIYNLYYSESGDTGRSVYVSGDTDKTFTDKFETSSNNSPKVYEYVRRANPVSTIDVEMPSEINFGIDVRANRLNAITEDNWQNYFYATEMKFKNNSLVCQDVFTDKDGITHEFGKANTNTNVGLEYMGVYSSGDMINGIELISSEKLESDIIIDGISGVRLALKLDDDTVIDESIGNKKPLKEWIIPYDQEKIISIKPNFGSYGNFFNIGKNIPSAFTLNSSHKFIFRYGLKE